MLLWDRQLWGGALPDYTGGPTPHPMLLLAGFLLVPIGTGAAFHGMSAVGALSFGTLVVATFLVGRRAFSTLVGAVASAAILLSPFLVLAAASGHQSMPFAALVMVAAAIELRAPRRGRSVLALLALAGLVRPEAWLLAAAYWIYLLPARSSRQRLVDAIFVVAAPLIWAGADLAVTGDPLWSLTSTQAGTEAGGRPTGLANLPYSVAFGFARLLGPSVVVGGVLGAVAALILLPRRATAFLVALGALGASAIVVLAVAGLPLLEKYFYIAALPLAVFFGVAVAGWTAVSGRSARRVWAAAGAALAVAVIVLPPDRLSWLGQVRQNAAVSAALVSDLHAFKRAGRAGAAVARCPRLFLADSRTRSLVAFMLDRPLDQVRAPAVTPDRRALLVATPEARFVHPLLLSPRGDEYMAGQGASSRLVLRQGVWELRAIGEPGCVPGPRPTDRLPLANSRNGNGR
jgi:hypothetical protein